MDENKFNFVYSNFPGPNNKPKMVYQD